MGKLRTVPQTFSCEWLGWPPSYLTHSSLIQTQVIKLQMVIQMEPHTEVKADIYRGPLQTRGTLTATPSNAPEQKEVAKTRCRPSSLTAVKVTSSEAVTMKGS